MIFFDTVTYVGLISDHGFCRLENPSVGCPCTRRDLRTNTPPALAFSTDHRAANHYKYTDDLHTSLSYYQLTETYIEKTVHSVVSLPRIAPDLLSGHTQIELPIGVTLDRRSRARFRPPVHAP